MRMTVRGVDDELVKRLKVLAVVRSMDMGEVMNEMIRFYLDNYQIDGVSVGDLKLYYDADRALRAVS